MTGTLFITGDPEADALLNTNGLALLIGMLLDQQVPMEWAFTGPSTLQARLGHLDPARIAAMSEDDFVAVCCAKPAIHRFPAAMGRRIHEFCGALVQQYPALVDQLWRGAADGAELYALGVVDSGFRLPGSLVAYPAWWGSTDAPFGATCSGPRRRCSALRVLCGSPWMSSSGCSTPVG